jgi:hypothetical protein
MKKVYLLILTVLICGTAVTGQNSLIFPANRNIDQQQITKFKPHETPSNLKSVSRWYNYGDAIDLILGGVGTYAANYIFPDSTMQVVYTGGVVGGTWIHKIGDVFDPTAYFFNDPTNYLGELNLLKESTYTLDSIEYYGFYMRGVQSPSVVDTLLVEVKVNNYPGSFSYFGPTSQVSINLGVDTVMFVDLLYDQATNSFGYTATYSYKIPLTVAVANDTLDNGINVIGVAPNLTIAANQHFYVSYSFIPGYAWMPNADSMVNNNRLRFLSMNENPGNFPVYTKHDWNASYILPQDVRYDAGGGWNGSYIPSFAYMGGASNTYSYIHHAIYYKCTGVTDFAFVSVPENETEYALAGAYPNPVNANSSMIIPFNTNDANASLIITDLLGQEVMKFNKIYDGKVVVNTSGLNAGIYFYTLVSGKNTSTKKFTVVR